MKKVMNDRLKTENERLKKMNERIERMKQKINNYFENVIHCFVQRKRKIENLDVHFENVVTIMKNERICRMHYFIQVVKILKFAANVHDLM